MSNKIKRGTFALVLMCACLFMLTAAYASPQTRTPSPSLAAEHAGSENVQETEAASTPTSAPDAAPTSAHTPVPTAIPDEPTTAPGRLEGLYIGLDPGHQEKGSSAQEPIAPGSSETKKRVSWGATGIKTKIEEYVTNLEISLKLRKRLIEEGAQVIMTRETSDVDISNMERAIMMNDAGVDIWFRVHCNGSDNQSKHGIGCYVRETGILKDECYFAGECMLKAISDATGARANGVYLADTYTGNNWSQVTCVLVEMGYITNPEEDVLLNTPSYQDKVVEGYINGLEVWWKDYSARKADNG